MSDEFEWGTEAEAPVQESQATPEAVEAPASEPAEAPASATEQTTPTEQPKPEVKPLHELFPKGSLVTFVKGDIKGNFGEVLGTEEKAAVTYLSIRVTHYVKGRPRTGDQIKTMTVRGSTVELVDSIPVYTPSADSSQAKAEKVAAKPAEAETPA